MYYHNAILLLFRPFIQYTFSQSTISPCDICEEAAENIRSITRSYRQLYTLRRTPTFMPYVILNSGVNHLIDGTAPMGFSFNHQTLNDLNDMCICHTFTKRSISIINYLSHNWNAILPQILDESKTKSLDGPYSYHSSVECLSLFNPNAKQEHLSDSTLAIHHYLFSPFPDHGLAVLPVEDISGGYVSNWQ